MSHPEHAVFISLVDAMRARGAVRVRSGALEVSFAEPYRKPEDPVEDHEVYTAAERELIEDARRRAEELP